MRRWIFVLYNEFMNTKKFLNDKERIEFAKQIEHMYEAAYGSWRRVMLPALLRGMFMGFGIVLGGSILVALLVWILGSLESIPLLGDLAESTRKTVEEN